MFLFELWSSLSPIKPVFAQCYEVYGARKNNFKRKFEIFCAAMTAAQKKHG
jgi:hypothetical protein